MKDLLDKLSSYNLFNYLLPGVLFAAFGTKFTSYTLLLDDIVIGVFVYYFYGLVISRVGSLIVGPPLQWLLKVLRIVEFEPYSRFVDAEKADAKLTVLSEQNNMYRTFCALFLALGVLVGADGFVSDVHAAAPVGGLALLFAIAYAKQCKYVTDRIRALLDEPKTDLK